VWCMERLIARYKLRPTAFRDRDIGRRTWCTLYRFPTFLRSVTLFVFNHQIQDAPGNVPLNSLPGITTSDPEVSTN
jgi:hypothetical protein